MADCAFPLCIRIAQKNGLCINHRIYEGEFPIAIIKELLEKPKPKKIKQFSDKRIDENKELAKIVAEIKTERPLCEMKVPGVCTGKTQTAHHTKGRVGKLLLSKKDMLASCYACNNWEVSHSAEAKAMGISKSRLSKV